MSTSVSLSVCPSICLSAAVLASIYQKVHIQASHISIHVSCGNCSVLIWRRCNKLGTSGIVDDVMFPIIGGMAGRHDATAAASLQCCAWANTSAARYWLQPVQTTAGAKSRRTVSEI